MPEPSPSSTPARGGGGQRRGHGGGARVAGDRRARRPRESAEARAARMARRRASVPPVTYPEHLPVVERRDDIAAAIRDHQVVVIAGETGSGKTTQIPKICLELGRGIGGMIGHTQPRRIAARSVAERLCEELDVELGGAVGYQVRFTDQASRDTLVKVMTDGILLSEMQRDRDLRRYDTLIIDEAHERSLNIDFILGYLKQLLPRRPDLKVIITSATIDPERFANHFAAEAKPAPIIEVAGRTYPVEIRYRPLTREQGDESPANGRSPQVEVDQVTGIVEAVEELWTENRGDGGGQDILVFVSGEREIRDAAEALTGLQLPGTEVLPLFGRLSAAEQHRVFARHSGRRIVLATNVAETSLTVPGIRYVVDTGTARISRYSQRLKVQRLPIEPISQASAKQRSGRCGRVADGIAIRLYSEEDFEGRPEFTDPEILRTNLASVILQMISLGLGEIRQFPFVEPPDSRQVADGVRLLEELQCLDAKATDPRRRLTAYGKSVARLPVDPRLARMLIEAERHGALREVLVVVAALSIQDVRERPSDKQAQADQQHARFKDEDSDFIALLNLWRYLKQQQKALSRSAFRRMCQREFLHYLRIREWQDLHTQLKQACKQLGLQRSDNEASAEAIHQSLLAGLLSHVGLRDAERRDYLGARGAHFRISPGSALFRKQPEWVMAAELVETSRLWARMNARTDPAWVERAAQHLVKHSYSEPHWEKKRGSAVALEKVTLYGVPLVAGRKVAYGRVNPGEARDLFIRSALVEGDWDTHHRFFHDNRKLLERLSDLEARARRRDIIVDEETLVDFYDERIPAEVVSARHFDAWWKKARQQTPDLLTFTEDALVRDEAAGAVHAATADYPQRWEQDGLELPLTYQFEPGAEADGVTVHVPVEVLNQVREEGFDWLVPGMREELATALVRSLPKAVRKQLVPAPDRARAALTVTDPGRGALTDELAEALHQQTGVPVEPTDFDWSKVPDHLRMTFRVEDRRRRPVGEGKDLTVLKERLAPQVRRTMARAATSVERTGLRTWEIGELPGTFDQRVGKRTVHGYPALVDHGDSVAVEVLASREERDAATRVGIRRLLLLGTTVPWKRILGLLSNSQKLALGNNPHGSVPALLEDCLAAAVDSLVAERPGATVRTAEDFDRALATVRREVVPRVIALVEAVAPALDRAREVDLALTAMGSPALTELRDDLRRQLTGLVHDGFVTEIGWPRVKELDRYLRAMQERIAKGPQDLPRDRDRAATVQRVEEERRLLLADLTPQQRASAQARELRWMVEELRVSLFAQRLGTAYPVSEKRIYKAMDAIG
ncbi:MAG TPA: ATP-dependent RNA helicase HrpA [Segeticoccus sp.]|uniref:ATP-dependent RNA helicase HrpA n=1 Tax=Segeticoccus sp. TaxID=2706531 RepID=UPI002D7E32B5|nr:ATP-dependent RNA helicase HrpA [Segeticoccus sp.]HET8600927.1 ATP-dependent RNA helicase HrpA [Segeticoccus sp.]